MLAHLVVGCLALAEPPHSSPKRPDVGTIARRAVLLGLPMATILAPATARADDLLEKAGKFVNVLKPFYRWEAPLQAGDYDKAAVRERIQKEIKDHPVVVYSYTLSPFCTEAKSLLAEQGVEVKAIELGKEWLPGLLSADAAAIRAELAAMTGQTSMPHVFIGGVSIGGLATGTPGLTPLLKAGSLRDRLQKAGAL